MEVSLKSLHIWLLLFIYKWRFWLQYDSFSSPCTYGYHFLLQVEIPTSIWLFLIVPLSVHISQSHIKESCRLKVLWNDKFFQEYLHEIRWEIVGFVDLIDYLCTICVPNNFSAYWVHFYIKNRFWTTKHSDSYIFISPNSKKKIIS